MSNYDQFSSEELLQVIEEYGRAEAEKERERIISLLEYRKWRAGDAFYSRDIDDLIEIIKGEN